MLLWEEGKRTGKHLTHFNNHNINEYGIGGGPSLSYFNYYSFLINIHHL